MTERCPMCGQMAEMIWVRAHYQCAACGQVILACCNGETALTCLPDAAAARLETFRESSTAHEFVEQSGKGS